MTATKTIKLKKPIKDGEIKEITLKEPNFGMIKRHGLPFSKDGEIDFQKASGLLEECSGVQEPFLAQMSISDSMEVIGGLAEFMADDEGNSN
jgi:hypothetical protein